MTPTEQKLREALEKAEWGARTLTQSFCPVCAGEERQGHEADCSLKAALAAPSPGETCKECSQPLGAQHYSACKYNGTSPFVIAWQCATPTKPAETGGQNIVKSAEPLGQINSVSTALPEAPPLCDIHNERMVQGVVATSWGCPECIKERDRRMVEAPREVDEGVTCPACRFRGIDWQCPNCEVAGVSEKTLLAALSSPPQRPKMTAAEALELYAKELESRYQHEKARRMRTSGLLADRSE